MGGGKVACSHPILPSKRGSWGAGAHCKTKKKENEKKIVTKNERREKVKKLT